MEFYQNQTAKNPNLDTLVKNETISLNFIFRWDSCDINSNYANKYEKIKKNSATQILHGEFKIQILYRLEIASLPALMINESCFLSQH